MEKRRDRTRWTGRGEHEFQHGRTQPRRSESVKKGPGDESYERQPPITLRIRVWNGIELQVVSRHSCCRSKVSSGRPVVYLLRERSK
jgi:hypothetical protein